MVERKTLLISEMVEKLTKEQAEEFAKEVQKRLETE